jgi:rhodanese-related sulfurtransferase
MTATQAFKIIDREALKQKLDRKDKFHFWNVVTRPYYNAERNIPGSKWIPADELGKALPSLGAAPSDEIVVYCSSFTCPASKQAAELLSRSGYTKVWAYEGGLADWMEGGFPVVKL